MPRTHLLIVLVAGCAAAGPAVPVDPDGAVDAPRDTADGGDARTIDAGYTDAAPAGTVGPDGACDPLLDECVGGLTCRLRGNHRGVCRPIGPLPAGAACEAEDDCGYAMTWFSDEVGVARCAVICDVLQPQSRCKPGQVCLALVGSTGICAL